MRRYSVCALLSLMVLTAVANAQRDSVTRSPTRTFAAVAAAIGAIHKDEFETTAAFQQRLRSRLDTSEVVLEIEPSSVSVTYDADQGRFTIEPRARLLSVEGTSNGYIAVTVRELNVTKGSHRASNAFGAAVTVVDRQSDRWTVASTIAAMGQQTVARLDVAPAAARSLKSVMRFFVSGHLAIGPDGSASEMLPSTEGATFSVPIETKIATHVLWMDGPEFQVVDARTKKILTRAGY